MTAAGRIAMSSAPNVSTPLVPVKTVCQGCVGKPDPTFQEAMADIADAGFIPNVLEYADTTYRFICNEEAP